MESGPRLPPHAGVDIIRQVASKYGHNFRIEEKLIGGAAIDATGSPLPEDTIDSCKESDAVLLGAVGGPRWSDPNAKVRPEQGLLKLRSELAVYANLRPVQIFGALSDASPIRPDRLQGVDLMVVRELTGGIYFGDKTRDESSASDLCTYHTSSKSNALFVLRQSSRNNAATNSVPSTRPTFSRRRDSGATLQTES